jgi:hypothetical protein
MAKAVIANRPTGLNIESPSRDEVIAQVRKAEQELADTVREHDLRRSSTDNGC